MDEYLPITVRCPVCGNDILPGTGKICELCATPHHQECWDYNFGCATFGCREIYIRRGMCTMCGQSTKEIAWSGRPIDLIPFERRTRAPTAPQLCEHCAEEHILTGGELPNRALSTVILISIALMSMAYGFSTISPLLISLSIVVGLIAFVWGFGVIKEMARNAQELPDPPRLGDGSKGKSEEKG